MTDMNKALSLVKEIKETSDIKEVARLLHSGNWIAICATDTEPVVFSLGRITDQKSCRENK